MSNSISVIIPCYYEEDITILNIINDLNKKLPFAEIIISDGSYNLKTKKIIAQMKQVKYIENNKHIRSTGLNLGARVATGEILIFLHSDTLLPENTFKILSELNIVEYNYGGFYKKFDYKNFWLSMNSFFSNVRLSLFNSLLGDNAIFVSKELFQAISGFPEISLMEDIEFSKKLRKHGKCKVIKNHVITSARKFLKGGIIKTIIFMQYIRLLHFLRFKSNILEGKYRSFGEK